MMKEKWIQTTIGEQVTLQRGFDITKSEQQTGNIPVISSSGTSSMHNIAAVSGPGVVLGRKGVIGSVFYIQSDYWPHDTTLWVKDFHGNQPRFVYYFLKNFALKLSKLDVGSANPTLNRNHVHPIETVWPSYAIQRRIAHILGSLDDKIELNRQMNETLEAMARAIFKSWFVDFDPVRTKAEGRQPAGMDAETAALFPDGFEEVDGREVPRRWRVVILPEVFEINPKRTLTKAQIAPYLDMQNIPIQGHRPIGWIQRQFNSGTKFINGDTLLARITPCLENGKTIFVDFLKNGEVGWGSTEYIVLRPKPPLPEEFGYLLARYEDFRSHAILNMSGSSGRQRVPSECFDSYQIVIPSDKIAEKFGDMVKPLIALIKRYDEQSHTLAQIRDSLQPKLMSGEINVSQENVVIQESV